MASTRRWPWIAAIVGALVIGLLAGVAAQASRVDDLESKLARATNERDRASAQIRHGEAQRRATAGKRTAGRAAAAQSLQRQRVVAATLTPTISIGDLSVLEGDSKTRLMSFPVTLSQPATTNVTVNYKIQGLTATGGKGAGKKGGSSGIDFSDRAGVGTVVFKPLPRTGLTRVVATVLVPVFGDTQIEPDETLTVTLSDPSGGVVLDHAVGTGTILDDDHAPGGVKVGIGSASILEGNSGLGRLLRFPVTLSQPSKGTVTVQYTVTSTTATYGKTAASPNADFGGATSGTVTFEASPATGFTPVLKTIAIPVWADTRPEPDEQITITLSNLSGPAGTSLVRASGTGTIVETKPRTKG